MHKLKLYVHFVGLINNCLRHGKHEKLKYSIISLSHISQVTIQNQIWIPKIEWNCDWFQFSSMKLPEIKEKLLSLPIHIWVTLKTTQKFLISSCICTNSYKRGEKHVMTGTLGLQKKKRYTAQRWKINWKKSDKKQHLPKISRTVTTPLWDFFLKELTIIFFYSDDSDITILQSTVNFQRAYIVSHF